VWVRFKEKKMWWHGEGTPVVEAARTRRAGACQGGSGAEGAGDVEESRS